MQYPSRDAFIQYASLNAGGSSSVKGKGKDTEAEAEARQRMADGFVLRTAGLAVQGLVCLSPGADPQCVQDPEGPVIVAAGQPVASL
jgi:hypothetical protein